jgi:eukaryotic-like serine/threonine-protein kinase
MMLPAPRIIDRFEIEHLAGRGGAGEVYRARDRETGAPVALKVLHSSDAEEVESFVREAWVLSSLDHPGIVRYITHGETDGGPYLVMEWLDGENLAQRLARQPLSAEESVVFVTRVAEALAAAHDRGVIHRDLKPSNLFLPGGRLSSPKILDFGTAFLNRALTAVGDATPSEIVGTPGYMSPEQARGESSEVDARADIFSLGCVLFECLAGRPAFVGRHAMAILAKILLEEAPRVSALKPEVPEALDELVARMLAKDVADRPRDAAALLGELSGLGGERRRAPERPRLLTAGEQRLLCVVLAAPRSAAVSDATLPAAASTERRSALAKLRDRPTRRRARRGARSRSGRRCPTPRWRSPPGAARSGPSRSAR